MQGEGHVKDQVTVTKDNIKMHIKVMEYGNED
jgi:hypothetical protein